MDTIFLGAREVGCIGIFTLLDEGCQINALVYYDAQVRELADRLGIPSYPSISDVPVLRFIHCDLLVSVHGREIVPTRLLLIPRYGGINVHPCLYRYPGAHPVERMLADGCTTASVGVHRMTGAVDRGEVLVEEYIDLYTVCDIETVYRHLYPYYSLVIRKALQAVRGDSRRGLTPDRFA